MPQPAIYHVSFTGYRNNVQISSGDFLIQHDIPQTMEAALHLKEACKKEALAMLHQLFPDGDYVQISSISRL